MKVDRRHSPNRYVGGIVLHTVQYLSILTIVHCNYISKILQKRKLSKHIITVFCMTRFSKAVMTFAIVWEAISK